MIRQLHGIRFTVGMSFFLFAIGLVGLLWLLQTTFVIPYYRNRQLTGVKTVAQEIGNILLESDYSTVNVSQRALQTIVNSNACVVVYNGNGKQLYYGDGLGSSCIFNGRLTINEELILPNPERNGYALVELLTQNNGEISTVLSNEDTHQETVLYGITLEKMFSDYYVFVNAPVEPIDAIINFMNSSYFVFAFVVIIMSLVISIVLSKRLSNPIVSMKQSAEELGKGKYCVEFNGGYFNETRELANTLTYATTQLGKVDELRKDLIANVSHDIKTPLTMITAYAEMIKDISGDNPVKRNEHLDVILKESHFLNRLVVDMSELSKMQSGNYELTLSDFDVVEVCKDMIDICQILLDKQHINVKLLGDSSALMNADEIKIGQVIYNFLTNAIKHSPNDSQIIVTILDLENTVRVEVKDNGEGIDQQHLPYVWDRYYKVDKQFARNSLESSGLGLAIVKAILDCHHAKYGVSSEVGKGSTFYFECPKIQYGLFD